MSLDNLIVERSKDETESESENIENWEMIPNDKADDACSESAKTIACSKFFAPTITPENTFVVKSVPLGKIPMSSMEEENFREKLHMAQLKKCTEFLSQEDRYTRDTFKRLFMNKVKWEK